MVQHIEEPQLSPADHAAKRAENELAALQREREGYARYGREDRAAEVEAAIKAAKKRAAAAPALTGEVETAVVENPGTETAAAPKRPARKA